MGIRAVQAGALTDALDRALPLRDVATMQERLHRSASIPRFRTGLAVGFAAIALALAAAGADVALGLRDAGADGGVAAEIHGRAAEAFEIGPKAGQILNGAHRHKFCVRVDERAKLIRVDPAIALGTKTQFDILIFADLPPGIVVGREFVRERNDVIARFPIDASSDRTQTV